MLTRKSSLITVALTMVSAFTMLTAPATAQFQQQRDRDAVAGGVAGAVIGGIIGHQNDETPEGALIGGAVGAIAGGLFGNSKDRMIEQQWQYDHEVQQYQMQEIAQAVSMNDVITLTQSGVSPNVIMNQIQMNGVQSKLTVNEIIAMSRSGVDETVINAMQQARIAGVSATRIAPAPIVVTPVYPARPVYTHRAPAVIIHHDHRAHNSIYHSPHRAAHHGHNHYRR